MRKSAAAVGAGVLTWCAALSLAAFPVAFGAEPIDALRWEIPAIAAACALGVTVVRTGWRRDFLAVVAADLGIPTRGLGELDAVLDSVDATTRLLREADRELTDSIDGRRLLAAEGPTGPEGLDGDLDDDGVPDGQEGCSDLASCPEPAWNVDSDKDGLINALDPDSDNDGLLDGTELGLDCAGPGTTKAVGQCTADADMGALRTIAETTGGAAHVAERPEDVEAVLERAISQG